MNYRHMLTNHLLQRCRAALEAGANRRDQAFAAGKSDEYRAAVRRFARETLGEMPFGAAGGPLNARIVSCYETPHYRIENVLFESLPGWHVNASVYLPKDMPPPWPAVVVPVGHSGKQFESYQIPAQVFARCGIAAVTFDPPGQSGEKQAGNDHFRNGIQCTLTGHSSNRYFVMDALRCIDYLESRPDIDLSRGVAMTGVSGGGCTTLWASLLDERIRCAAPSCCITPLLYHPIGDCYPDCPEHLSLGRIEAGLDDVDLLCALRPLPLLVMAGRQDEVFKLPWTLECCVAVRACYHSAGAADRFQVFVDEGGHAYTVAQALQCARWIYRWIRNEPEHPLPQLHREDLSLDPPEALRCRPPAVENMFTINRALSERLSRERSSDDLPRRVFRATRLDLRRGAVTNAYAEAPASVWAHFCQEVCLEPEPGIMLPATFLYPQDRSRRRPTLLYFDDQGRWTQLREHGMLARCARFLEREAEIPAAVLSVDLRGWGETQPAPVPYDLASWAGKGRLLSYLSAGLNDSLLGMRVRDALAALQYLRQREEVDPEQIFVGGRGLGAVVALHVAVLDSGISGVMAAAMPGSFALLAQDADYTWPPEAFPTGVLRHYDLPELVTALAPLPLLLINPLDARQQSLTPEQAETLYPSREGLVLRAGLSEAESADTQVEWMRALAGAA